MLYRKIRTSTKETQCLEARRDALIAHFFDSRGRVRTAAERCAEEHEETNDTGDVETIVNGDGNQKNQDP